MKKVVMNIIYSIQFYKILVLKKILSSEYVVNSLRVVYKYNIGRLLSYYGAEIGAKSHFKGCLNIDNHSYGDNLFENLAIGKNCYIGKNVYLDLANKISIEEDAVISSSVTILTHADVGNRKMAQYYKRISKKTVIGEGSWIGANATILPGVTIGKCCIVSAGSVVNKDIQDYSVVAGVPAEFKRGLEN